MARRKTPPLSLQTKHVLAERIMSLRIDLFGPRGGPELARRLGIPVRTWYNYEGGITVPGEILLKIIEVTSVEPRWLLHGTGPKFSGSSAEPNETKPGSAMKATAMVASALRHQGPEGSNVAVCALLRAALRLLGNDRPLTSEQAGTGFDAGEFDARTPVADPDLPSSERNAPHIGRASGNGTVH